jgi:DNA-binding winged helix-turn-helix (wHTH) protein/TolB-like protein
VVGLPALEERRRLHYNLPVMFRFGRFDLDAAGQVLLRDGKPMPLTPKTLQTLVVLVERRGRIVTKDELMREVWPDTFVEEANVTQHVSMLRKMFSDADSDGRQLIETFPKRGYRFVGPVEIVADGPAGATAEAIRARADTSTSPAPTVPASDVRVASPDPKRWPRTAILAAMAAACLLLAIGVAYVVGRSRPGVASAELAVLPLRVLASPAAEGSHLGVGIADAIVTRLANVESIRVRPTSAILAFDVPGVDPSEAGRRLRVDHVLTGTVQQVADAYRFNLQLVRTADGVPVWGRSLDLNRRNLFSLEDQVAADIVGALALRISRAERARIDRRYTSSPEAYEQYLEGRALLANYSDSNARQAMEHFDRALRIDPHYVLAEAGLATASGIFSVRFAYEREALDWGRRAEQHARAALAQDPGLGEAHLALASAAGTMYRSFDWPMVIDEATEALRLNPNLDLAHSALARALYHLGLFDRSRDESRRAEEISGGTNVEVRRVGLYNHLLAGHFDEARRLAESLLQRTDAPVVRQYLGLSAYYTGDPERAKQVLGAVLRSDGRPDSRSQASLAGILAATGARADAERTIALVLDAGYMDHHVAYSLGAAQAQLGRPADAIKWLRKATETGFPCYPWFAADSLLDPLRANPAFREFLDELRRTHEAARARYGQVEQEKR